MAIIKGPLEAVAGLTYGVLFGILMWYLPHKHQVSGKYPYYSLNVAFYYLDY